MKLHAVYIGNVCQRKRPIWIKAESVDKGSKYIKKTTFISTWGEGEWRRGRLWDTKLPFMP